MSGDVINLADHLNPIQRATRPIRTSRRVSPASEPKIQAEIGRVGKQRSKDDDKRATTRLEGRRHRGVWLQSRHNKACQIGDMEAAIDYLHRRGAHFFHATEAIFMDSKAGMTMGVDIRTSHQGIAELVAE